MSFIPLERLDPALVGPRCLVVGGAGFLGQHLARALVELGCEVRIFDRVKVEVPGALSIKGDLRHEEEVVAVCEGIDVVFHCAAVMAFAGMAPRKVRQRMFEVNVGGTRHVIEACQRQGVGRLVYTSTANVCIDREIVDVGEESPYARRFVDLYGESKTQAEQLVLAADDPEGLRTCAIRPGGIWGGAPGGYMIQAFLDQVAAGRFSATIGSGEAVVDNTHVDNLAWAELLAASRLHTDPDVVGGQAYFVTDDERLNGITWFKPITDAIGIPWPRLKLPAGLMYVVAWVGEFLHLLGLPEPPITRIGILKLTRSSAFLVDKARKDLGWEVLVQRDEGLAHHMDDYRAYLEARRGR